MKPFTLTVQPVLVRDSAVRMLRNAIITGEIKSGTRLIERELCEALGVSRGSVREVIRQLEAERLITQNQVCALIGTYYSSVAAVVSSGVWRVVLVVPIPTSVVVRWR